MYCHNCSTCINFSRNSVVHVTKDNQNFFFSIQKPIPENQLSVITNIIEECPMCHKGKPENCYCTFFVVAYLSSLTYLLEICINSLFAPQYISSYFELLLSLLYLKWQLKVKETFLSPLSFCFFKAKKVTKGSLGVA